MSSWAEGFSFVWPQLLWLLPLPLLLYWLLPPLPQQQAALRLPTFKYLEQSAAGASVPASLLKLAMLFLLWSLLLLAAARPQWIGEPVQLPASGRDLLLAVDISQSMETTDMIVNQQQTSRIDVIKQIVSEFVDKRNGDRLGLVVFGSEAFLHVPLTFDRKVVGQQLQEAQLGFAGPSTAIGDAIAITVKKLRALPTAGSNGRVVILLTDGANTSGEIEPREAARLAHSAGIKIYTIGLGADSMIERGFLFNREINPSADLDEATLTYIADITGGQYFRARSPRQLQQVYEAINELEPLPQEAETFRPIKELFYYPAAAALLLSMLWLSFSLISLFVRGRRHA